MQTLRDSATERQATPGSAPAARAGTAYQRGAHDSAKPARASAAERQAIPGCAPAARAGTAYQRGAHDSAQPARASAAERQTMPGSGPAARADTAYQRGAHDSAQPARASAAERQAIPGSASAARAGTAYQRGTHDSAQPARASASERQTMPGSGHMRTGTSTGRSTYDRAQIQAVADQTGAHEGAQPPCAGVTAHQGSRLRHHGTTDTPNKHDYTRLPHEADRMAYANNQPMRAGAADGRGANVNAHVQHHAGNRIVPAASAHRATAARHSPAHRRVRSAARRRIALKCVCALAVLLAALLWPATCPPDDLPPSGDAGVVQPLPIATPTPRPPRPPSPCRRG